MDSWRDWARDWALARVFAESGGGELRGPPSPAAGLGWRKCNGGLGLGEEAEAIIVIPFGLRVKSSYGWGCGGAERKSGSAEGSNGCARGCLRADCGSIGTDCGLVGWD